jgi:hypothetical protein
LWKVRNQCQEEELVAKLPEQTVLQAAEVGIAGAADHDKGVPAGEQPGARLLGLRMPVAVVAIARLEIFEVLVGSGQRAALSRSGDQHQAGKVVRAEGARIVHRQVGEQRHAVILDLPVADRAVLVRVVQHQRSQQEFPVRRDARRAEAETKDRYLLRFS